VFHLFDLTVVNAWPLYRRDCTGCKVRSKDQLSLLKFKAYVAGCLCRQETGEVKNRGWPRSPLVERKFEEKKMRGPTAALPVADLCEDAVSHWPIFTEKRGRCKEPGCSGVPKVLCVTCKVHLYLPQTLIVSWNSTQHEHTFE
jgi:hypothetical protein